MPFCKGAQLGRRTRTWCVAVRTERARARVCVCVALSVGILRDPQPIHDIGTFLLILVLRCYLDP